MSSFYGTMTTSVFFSVQSQVFKNICLFIYGCIGSPCCMGFSLVAVSKGYSLFAVCRLLIVIASLVAQHSLHGLWASVTVAYRLSSCNSWALEHEAHPNDFLNKAKATKAGSSSPYCAGRGGSQSFSYIMHDNASVCDSWIPPTPCPAG